MTKGESLQAWEEYSKLKGMRERWTKRAFVYSHDTLLHGTVRVRASGVRGCRCCR